MTGAKVQKKTSEGFLAISTSTISDALDKMGIPGGCLGIEPLVQGVKMAGPALTVRYIPVGAVKGTVGDYIDQAKAGDVIVLDNGGRKDCTVWGDILTLTAQQKGIAGTVIDGVCRDVSAILEDRYPLFSRGKFMMTGKDRVMVEATNQPVSIGGTQVRPGDIMVGDDNGVVVVPFERAVDVLEAASAIDALEENIKLAVRKGNTLQEAREKFGYHKLQTRN